VGVRDGVTEARPLAADVAVGSHGCSPDRRSGKRMPRTRWWRGAARADRATGPA
jgi:hypothetical protein